MRAKNVVDITPKIATTEEKEQAFKKAIESHLKKAAKDLTGLTILEMRHRGIAVNIKKGGGCDVYICVDLQEMSIAFSMRAKNVLPEIVKLTFCDYPIKVYRAVDDNTTPRLMADIQDGLSQIQEPLAVANQ